MTEIGCLRCAQLRARFEDPETPNPGAFLHAWARHHLDDHGVQPAPRADCPKCQQFLAPIRGIHERLRDLWGKEHFMKCALAPKWMDAVDRGV